MQGSFRDESGVGEGVDKGAGRGMERGCATRRKIVPFGNENARRQGLESALNDGGERCESEVLPWRFKMKR